MGTEGGDSCRDATPPPTVSGRPVSDSAVRIAASPVCARHQTLRPAKPGLPSNAHQLLRDDRPPLQAGEDLLDDLVGRPSIIVANRLHRESRVDCPGRAWVTDITCIRTWQGRLYLAVVMDLFDRVKNASTKRIYKTRDLTRADIFDYIEVVYNRQSPLSHPGGVSPEALEQASF